MGPAVSDITLRDLIIEWAEKHSLPVSETTGTIMINDVSLMLTDDNEITYFTTESTAEGWGIGLGRLDCRDPEFFNNLEKLFNHD